MDLQTLLDEREISRLAIGYAAALDDRDWTAFRALFTDNVDIDSQALRGQPPSRMSAEAWTTRVRASVELFDAVLHYNLNHRIEINGDEGVCHTYGFAHHEYATPGGRQRFVVHARYAYGVQRMQAGWRIASVTIQFVMREGEPPPPRT